ncbi:hypothetical protein CBR_g40808 [Chara braunii]|uniref:Uncharacterized protein n=1 Tax=Chara braunii TaxID=69332 RepID=A0A388LUR1_CHABU|nr:hypothetical protein CBR_g40808 [Chara braunii]|eukprot:GBG85995.1 hypothetical protein CBR_g40808 [Chara braunii]
MLTPALAYVFGGFFVCKDAETAKQVAFNKNIMRPCVTLEGDLYNPSGLLTGGTRSKGGSVLTKLHELSSIEMELETHQEALSKATAELANLSSAMKEHRKLTSDLELCSHQLTLLQGRLEQSEHYKLGEEVASMEHELAEAKKAVDVAARKGKELAEEKLALEKRIAEAGREREKWLKTIQEDLKSSKQQLSEAAKSIKGGAQEVERLTLEKEALLKERKALEDQILASGQQIIEIEKVLLEMQTKEGKTKEELSKAQESLDERRSAIKAQEAEIAALIRAQNKLSKKIVDSNNEIKKLDHQMKRIEAEQEDASRLVQNLLQKHDWISRERQLFGKPGTDYDFNSRNAKEAHRLYEAKEAEYSSLEKRVNKKVISMFEKAEQEYNQLIAKKSIIQKDKVKIEKVIEELDEKKRQSLHVAWLKVNKDFGSIFSTLLPGTNAKLDPPEGGDFMDGLEVKVAFGTVWKQSLSELSGGQRSLLALSLILALLLFKPAPLYILDEVDAALDLSHTQNIGRMIKAHFPHSQFVVVSLKEGMFNNANVIFRTKGRRRDTGSTAGEGSAVGFDSTSVADRGARDSRGPDIPEEIAEHLRGPVLAAARPPQPPSGAQQSSMTNFVVDEPQREFDQVVASLFFENAIAFNAARSDSYKNMERIMNMAARSRKMLRMPGHNYLRTKALPADYKDVDKDLDKIREPWDVTGLTLMTDGTTTTSNRPVVSFIPTDDSGAVMVRSVDMEEKDKSAPALARMWVEVILELGVQRVNAICTDSAHVNISVKKILEKHDDPAIRSIPWVSCACHVCNLLMCDIASVPWIGEAILQGREITTFIKRHQRALAMFRKSGREYRTQLGIKEGRPLELIQPGETRFGTNFLVLQRLRECEPGSSDKGADVQGAHKRPGLVVDRACTVLEPVYALMKNMDRDGRMGMQVWSLGITLEKRMVVIPMDCETRGIVMTKVKDRVRMMALPVHAAAWMLHPLHRSPRLFNDLASEEIANTLTHFASVHAKTSKEYKECWNSLKSFHHMHPEWISPNSEEALTGGHVSMVQWWLTYGKRHPTLTKIAVKVLSMWTTASPCERNWSTFDLVHTKRRNLLSPENLEMLVFIHWNKKLLRMSKAKMGFVNTERLERETPEDEAPFDGFMREGEYDPVEILEEREDDGAWLLDVSYRPRRLADDGRGKTVVADYDEEDDGRDSDGDAELLDVHLTDKRLTRRLGGGSCSATDVAITPQVGPVFGGAPGASSVSLADDTGCRARLRTSASGGVSSVQGTSTPSDAQHTPLPQAAVEETAACQGMTDGGSGDAHVDSAAARVVRDFGVSVDAPVPGHAEHEDGHIDAGKDDELHDAAEDSQSAGGKCILHCGPWVAAGERFASLLHHVAPIAARGSKTDFEKHLAAMSPMRSDSGGQTPDWARFTGPTPPALLLSKDIPTDAGDGSRGMVDRRRAEVDEDRGLDRPQAAATQCEAVSPPEIDASKVRQVRSLAGRKKGGKNKPKEPAGPAGRGGRGGPCKTVTPPTSLQEKRAVVQQAKKRKAQKVSKKVAAASQSPRRNPKRRRTCVQEDDDSESNSASSSSDTSSSNDASSSCDASSSSDTSSRNAAALWKHKGDESTEGKIMPLHLVRSYQFDSNRILSVTVYGIEPAISGIIPGRLRHLGKDAVELYHVERPREDIIRTEKTAMALDVMRDAARNRTANLWHEK